MTNDATPQPGHYYAPPQPPKKRHTVRNVLLVVAALMIAAMAGCAALLGSAAESVDDALDAEAKNDKPSPVAEGKAFEHDIWSVQSGWKVKRERFTGDTTIKGLRAENTGESADHSMLTFTLERGSKVLASVDCTSDRAEPGQSIKLTCISTDKMPKRFGSISVRDSW